MCPVCTVSVIAGLSISRFFGIDDLITSLWIGGLTLSLSFITIDWIEKSKWHDKILEYMCKVRCGITEHQALRFWVFFLMYVLAIVPLSLNHTIGITRNTIFGIDKISFGIFMGSVVFLIGIWADKAVRKSRDGKQLFIYQKVVFPVLSLLVTSLVFYFLTK